ncbi:2-oxoglutarate synthase [Thiocapsa imhoffii]|uniref:2-oxoglutarate synthase n=1 Tax=Thiocapsa imhoffii TaxID=382777 RepID=A0A9X0WGP9_9GAMM|nr:2-oxoacid:acceptor oxidoreductase subunit alpha [Thiocapsa imhoffii]MBK1643974.1 2-oxoglutarate synthase [Thiocapsa imhoffii]
MNERLTHDPGTAIAIIGSGGSGAVTAGLILLAAVGHTGYYGLLGRSAGPQIRGGESAAMLRFGPHPVECMGDHFDLLVALDWDTVGRFADELPLACTSMILTDARHDEVPAVLGGHGASVHALPWRDLASTLPEGRVNMVALGSVGALLGLPFEALEAGVRATLGEKGERILAPSLAGVRAGYASGVDLGLNPPRVSGGGAAAPVAARWNLSGNEAAGLGAVRGGVRFVAAYPITPASEMLEWLAPRLELLGGSLLQAEDELASVNMIIGASFGGVPSLTATSGPGLSLMMEGLGLAVASETPVVVVNVQRGGPSTGIPTKSEQSDLNIALHGLHGDAPHLVLAALGIRDCAATVEWGVRLAEHLQTAAIVLSDQILGQSRAIVDPLTDQPFGGAGQAPLQRVIAPLADSDHRRYRSTATGISPMTLPGMPGGMYTADGLEHNEAGTPSSRAADHLEQLEKRLRKLTDFDYGSAWAEIRGEGERVLLTWGSAAGAVFEAAARLRAAGSPTKAIALRLLAPLPRAALLDALGGASQILVVEQNQGAQCFAYLHSLRVLPGHASSYARPGPLPLRPGEILDAVERDQPTREA